MTLLAEPSKATVSHSLGNITGEGGGGEGGVVFQLGVQKHVTSQGFSFTLSQELHSRQTIQYNPTIHLLPSFSSLRVSCWHAVSPWESYLISLNLDIFIIISTFQGWWRDDLKVRRLVPGTYEIWHKCWCSCNDNTGLHMLMTRFQMPTRKSTWKCHRWLGRVCMGSWQSVNRYLLCEFSFLCVFPLSVMTVKIAGPVEKDLLILAISSSLVREIKLWLTSFKTSCQGYKVAAGQRQGNERGRAF